MLTSNNTNSKDMVAILDLDGNDISGSCKGCVDLSIAISVLYRKSLQSYLT